MERGDKPLPIREPRVVKLSIERPPREDYLTPRMRKYSGQIADAVGFHRVTPDWDYYE